MKAGMTERNGTLPSYAEAVRRCHILQTSVREMGIGNTSSSSPWMTCLTKHPLHRGAGSGLPTRYSRHSEVLKQSLDNYRGDKTHT